MTTRLLGGRPVGAIGLGCMGMSFAYGVAEPADAHAVLERALELGIDHWDTADMYGAGANEELIAPVLARHRARVFLATKCGNVFDRTLTSHQHKVQAEVPFIVDGTPAYIRQCLDRSLARLGTDYVDLYYQHRVDPDVPIEETVGELGRQVQAGKIRAIGLSEASASTIRRAHAVHPVAAVQSELSLWTRDYLADVVPLCAELGIAFVAYSPLGRGFLTGAFRAPEDVPEGDWRRVNPRFAEAAFAANLAIVEVAQAVAARHQATPAQVALAWTLAQGEHILPIPGTKKLKYLEENAAAADLELSADDLSDLNQAPLAVGTRYPEHFMPAHNI